ncbi:MAG: acyltransferase family protein, partial [Treponema sp.]
FFLIAGYLFFAKPKPASQTLKSKVRGIIVPYALWTFLAILTYFVAQSFSFSKSYFSQPQNLIRNWRIKDYARAFFAHNNVEGIWYPFVFPFWYLRNLLLLMGVSSFIKKAAQKFPASYFIAITILDVLSLTGALPDSFRFFDTLFFFSLGFYAVKHIAKVISVLDSIKTADFLLAYGSIAAFSIITGLKSIPLGSALGIGMRCITICGAIKLAGFLSKKERIYARLAELSHYSFWIYASHAPFIVTAVKKLGARIIPLHGGFMLVQSYGLGVLCIGTLLLFGIAFRKTCPKTFALLTGGRGK